MKLKQSLLALLSIGLMPPALAAGIADQVSVAEAYVRLAPPGSKTTGAFMTLKNGGATEARLVKAESTVAKVTELHSHTNDNGVMRMRQVKEITVPAQGEVQLKPGGYHVMLIDMNSPLKVDDHVVIKLGFADGSSREVHAMVKNPMANMPMGGAMDGHQGMDHSKMKH